MLNPNRYLILILRIYLETRCIRNWLKCLYFFQKYSDLHGIKPGPVLTEMVMQVLTHPKQQRKSHPTLELHHHLPFKFLPEAERLLAAPVAEIKLTESPPTRCWEMKCVKAWRLPRSSGDWVR